jgi:membrane associated rhomboid family serine protease
VVIGLIIINVVVFLFTEFAQIPVPRRFLVSLAKRGQTGLASILQRYGMFITFFSLFPVMIRYYGWVWQVFTYMFLHGSLLHIFFNMYTLLLFGKPLEERWGKWEFLKFYFFTGVGAGIVTFFWNLATNPLIPTIGASGAIFGIVLAFGLEFPETVLLLFFVLPVKAKYAALMFGGIELVMIATGSLKGIGHFTHLAGLVFGFIYYQWWIRRRYRNKRFYGLKFRGSGNRGKTFPIFQLRGDKAIDRARVIRNKLALGVKLGISEERFLSKLRQAYELNRWEICGPDEFDEMSASDCTRCVSLYACLYRYIFGLR